jgi:hypothetical protein
MTDSKKLAELKLAVASLIDAICHDQGGFCVETLHAIATVSEVAGLPDYTGVTAATNWTISGEGEENVRFFGAAAHADSECN